MREASGTFIEAEGLTETSNILTATMPKTIYYYEDGMGETVYVRSAGSATDDADMTTYTWQIVDIRKGAKIPEGADYNHLHFGVWSAIGEADEDGNNEITELGIAFVQNFVTGGSMTEEMPNNGSGEYAGNWVANVQEADSDGDGDINQLNGPAFMDANFRLGTVDINLSGLAMLKAGIDREYVHGRRGRDR